MELSKSQIADAFSRGDFEKIYAHLSEDIEWTVFQQFQIKGKIAVIKKCEETAEHFKKVDTDFRKTGLIATETKIVLTGTAEFSKKGQKLEFVDACDVYEFDAKNFIKSVSSYCVVKKHK